ncbi:tetraspanning orphan receptor [Drosophila tropicalis]|uniref:tetraspanning orphan receptor n=1 Tax=Drosophila tropicalis TaxID=46794 RepID=UPI0035AB9F6E
MLRIHVKMGPQRSHNNNNNNNGNSAASSNNHNNNNSNNISMRNNKEFTCCFGLHVHTATLMIGLWHLFLNILALSVLAVIWRNPEMMDELESGGSHDYTIDLNAPALPTPLSKVDPPYAFRDHSLNYRKRYQNFDMGGLVCTCMIAITLMMIYGTIKGKPSHLLPFFCLQLFDFAITTLTAAGYLCYLQAIHRIIAESHRLPWREKLLELPPEELVVVVLVVFICIVFLKAYCIGIVWRCYKYLTLRQQHLRSLLPCVLPEMGLHGVGVGGAGGFTTEEQRAYTTLLPNYDEAIAQYLKQAPPPSYQVAMSNYQDDDENGGAAGGGAAGGITPLFVTLDNVNGATANAASNTDENMDNNNDVPNNNNTMHVNANTPPMRRSEAGGAAATGSDEEVEDDDDDDWRLLMPVAWISLEAFLRHRRTTMWPMLRFRCHHIRPYIYLVRL